MATFNNTMVFNAPAIGSPAASWGSNIFVVHDKVGVADAIGGATAGWNQPHQLVANYDSTAVTLGLNSQEIIVPDAGLSLELFLTSDTAANHTVTLGVWGKVPAKDGVTGLDRKWPSDVDATNYADPTDMWIPLQNLEAVWVAKDGPTAATDQGGVITIQMDVADHFHFEHASKEWFMGHRTSVYLAGCTSICVGVKTGDSVSNGMLLGRFVG
tara:strand:+ start:26109 stop:26747 length:639 start_codon:yes stop_codon:yes gene_type:complete